MPPSTIKSSIALSARWHDMWWRRCIGATLKSPARHEPHDHRSADCTGWLLGGHGGDCASPRAALNHAKRAAESLLSWDSEAQTMVQVHAEVRTKFHPCTGHPSGGGTPCSGPQIKSRHQRFSTFCDSKEQLHLRHQPGCMATGREGQRAGL